MKGGSKFTIVAQRICGHAGSHSKILNVENSGKTSPRDERNSRAL